MGISPFASGTTSTSMAIARTTTLKASWGHQERKGDHKDEDANLWGWSSTSPQEEEGERQRKKAQGIVDRFNSGNITLNDYLESLKHQTGLWTLVCYSIQIYNSILLFCIVWCSLWCYTVSELIPWNIDFAGVDLVGVDLAGGDFVRVDLVGTSVSAYINNSC